jgi:hypothetical protein
MTTKGRTQSQLLILMLPSTLARLTKIAKQSGLAKAFVARRLIALGLEAFDAGALLIPPGDDR